MSGLDWPRSLRILAFKEAVSKDPSSDFLFRKIYRWYSKTFATPLHVVETLPLYDVLQAYYEDYAVSLVESADNESHLRLQQELADLSKSDEELAKEQAEKDRREMLDRRLLSSMESENTQIGQQGQLKKKRELEEKLKRDRKAADAIANMLTQDPLGARLDINSNTQPETSQDEDINMSFVDLDGIEDVDGLTGLG